MEEMYIREPKTATARSQVQITLQVKLGQEEVNNIPQVQNRDRAAHPSLLRGKDQREPLCATTAKFSSEVALSSGSETRAFQTCWAVRRRVFIFIKLQMDFLENSYI